MEIKPKYQTGAAVWRIVDGKPVKDKIVAIYFGDHRPSGRVRTAVLWSPDTPFSYRTELSKHIYIIEYDIFESKKEALGENEEQK